MYVISREVGLKRRRSLLLLCVVRFETRLHWRETVMEIIGTTQNIVNTSYKDTWAWWWRVLIAAANRSTDDSNPLWAKAIMHARAKIRCFALGSMTKSNDLACTRTKKRRHDGIIEQWSFHAPPCIQTLHFLSSTCRAVSKSKAIHVFLIALFVTSPYLCAFSLLMLPPFPLPRNQAKAPLGFSCTRSAKRESWGRRQRKGVGDYRWSCFSYK